MAASTHPRAQTHTDRGTVILYVLLTFGAVLMALPLVQMILTSLKSAAEAAAVPPTLFPANPSLSAYRTVLTEAPFFTWFRNSVVVALSVTAIQLFTSTLGGYIFAKFDFPFRNILFTLILATLMVPFPVVLIPVYLIISKLQLINTLFALIVPSMVTAFGMFLMRQFAAAVPSELLDAARLDGAGEFTIYARLVLPQLRPAMATLGIFTFMATWNDYLWPLIVINDQNRMTLPLALTFFNSQHSTRYDLMMAASVLIIGPIILIFLFFQRQFVNAVALSGMK